MNDPVFSLSHITVLAQATPSVAAPAAGAGQPPPPGIASMLVPLGLMFVMFYFVIIRPQRKRAEEHKQLLSTLKAGEKVITSGGIHGIVISIKDDVVSIKVAEGKMEVDKAHVERVVRDKAEAAVAKK